LNISVAHVSKNQKKRRITAVLASDHPQTDCSLQNAVSWILLLKTQPKSLSNIAADKDSVRQEGQHPLTGQRAANFRLLAN